MRMSRDRIFYLADSILKELTTTPGVQIKNPDEVRTEILRALTDESKLEETIDSEVRRTLSTYARPAPEGSHEWQILYQKTREEVYKKRFRL
jgi:hypothetical protein